MRLSLVRRFALLLVAVAPAACVDDDDTSAPTLDAEFLGYTEPATKQTSCGNCHVSVQGGWVATAHASAWSTLQNSGSAQSFCEGCHTTGGQSNPAPDSAGYFSVGSDARPFYQDVQCEACHGPGVTHAQAPDASQPLSTIAAATGLDKGCGTCHTGTHHPFLEEWARSGHSRVVSNTIGNPNCTGCHSGQAALARFDPNAKYEEQTSTTPQPITCAVCHDPHGSANSAQLRFSINTADVESNLCMLCHQRRSNPQVTSSSGPHSPQGPTLLGESGWFPPNYTINAISSHGPGGNPRMCATCHVDKFDVTDAATGDFVFHSTGHSFRAIPCMLPGGVPDTLNTCDTPARTFRACATSGCHATEAAARSAFSVDSLRFDTYLKQLWHDGDGDHSLDAFPTDTGLVPRVRQGTPADFSTSDNRISVGEGAYFNAALIPADASHGVHNPFHLEGLMLATIQALQAQYPYLPAPPAAVRAAQAERARRIGLARR